MENENPFKTLVQQLTRIETLLLDINNAQNNKVPSKEKEEDEFMDINQAACFLKKAKQTVYGLIHRKKLPHMKKFGKLYFSKKELIGLIQNGRKKTIEELKTEADDCIIK
jgi:predicted DNA-binding transcriptional regulator AlpA